MSQLKLIYNDYNQMVTSIFRANDIRGVYPDQINEETVYRIAQAYATFLSPKKVVVGMDVRLSSPKLHQALIKSLVDAGASVADLGLTSIEQMYFAVGYYVYSGGIMVTASHNPQQFNGLKMVGGGVGPIGEEEIREIKNLVSLRKNTPGTKGKVEKLDIFEDYKDYLFKFVDLKNIKHAKIVANANFGFQGQVALRLLKDLPVTLSLLNGEPNGNFPKGRPDPFVPANRIEFLEKIKMEKPSFGITWDADGDRVFFATDDGEFIEAYYTSALLAQYFLQKHPQEKIIYDSRYTWAIIDTVKKMGGVPILSKVGHTYIKQAMREHNAIFCGEASGHTYFRDYFFCESGFLPLLLIMELISKSSKSLKELIEPIKRKYFISGEINFEIGSEIGSYEEVLDKIKKRYADATDITEFDGVSVEFGRNWRCNIRHSHTENYLRLNLEANSQQLLEAKKEELVKLISSVE